MGSKKQTVGYWYKLLLHFGLCRGPFDAFLALRGGDRDAWTGLLTSSSTININAEQLWGGENGEGGISGSADVMFGEADQEPNSYLAQNLGSKQSGYRGRGSFVFKGGRWGAFNPYPKAASFKVRRIKKAWDNDACWYPERAEIPVVPGFAGVIAGFRAVSWNLPCIAPVGAACSVVNDSDSFTLNGNPDDIFTVGLLLSGSAESKFYTGGVVQPGAPTVILGGSPSSTITPNHNIYRLTISNPAATYHLNYTSGSTSTRLTLSNVPFTVEVAGNATVLLEALSIDGLQDPPSQWMNVEPASIVPPPGAVLGMNPAHILYQSICDSWMDSQPIASINDASFRAAADRLYSEGFGLCTKYLASQETIEAFQQRICNVISASLSRSPLDGQWYLDLIRGDYVLEDLPVLDDDDILEFSEQPSSLDDAVNQVIVQWFDPKAKEDRSTPAVQALGAIQTFGRVVSEVKDYPEIPEENLAIRAAARDLKSKATPLRRFSLTTNRVPYAWRPGQQFRLQAPKRGISDMVCLIGEVDRGSLNSGAIQLTVVQDVFGMPLTVYVDPEPGVDTQPSQTPTVITVEDAFEAPYIALATYMSPGDLSVLAPDAGFIGTVAEAPAAGGRNFNLFTSAGGGYVDQGIGEWCPTGVIDTAVTRTIEPVDVEFSEASQLTDVSVGALGMWAEELVRVDALDVDALTATLARGVGDTTPQIHAAGERIWFSDADAAQDPTEYSDGETVSAKLLTNTESQQLDISLATAMTVTMDSRQARPYPPGDLSVNGEEYPGYIFGPVVLTWAHRHRTQQADQLIDTSMSSIGPEPGTTYNARWYINGVLLHTESGITGTTATYTPSSSGTLRIEVESQRDGLVSWQASVHECDYTTTEINVRITPDGDLRVTPSGDLRII